MSIRPAVAADGGPIGALVAEALSDKVGPAFGDHGPAALAALVRRDLPRRTVRYFVAESGGDLVGTARVAIGQEASQEGLAPVARAIGWRRAIRGSVVLGLLAHRRLDPDEAYIEELAVRADRRREGLGRSLLEACEAAAVAAGKRRTTLWVTERNTAAVALYRSAGYRVARRKTTLRGRLLFGAAVALLMQRDLPAARPETAIVPSDAARPDTP